MRRSEAINPRSITYLSYILWSFPVTYVLLLGTFYNLPMSKLFMILFSFYYLAHAALAVFTGFALFHMKPYAWHIYLVHSFVMIVEQFYVALVLAENHVVEIPLAFVCLVVVLSVLLVKFELRVPYFSPKIAWWESDPRYKISVPTEMTCANHFYRGEIMDVSASGCFVKTKEPLRVDQEVQIKFALFDHRFEINGKVVWRTESGVTHPKGVGVRFIHPTKTVQHDLRETVKKLRMLSKNYKNLRNEEKVSTIEQKVQNLLSQRKS